MSASALPLSDVEARAAWRSLRATTWLMCTLVFLAAFESLAVTTAMPVVSEALDGAGMYAFAFAGPLATSVVGMVVAGAWSDRSGPRGSFLAAVGLFAAGLVVAGAAPTMGVLVAGRLVQGLGAGAITVALYVMVARLYPGVLHPRVFAGFSAAWVLPALVGPPIAGFVAEHVDWRWVFLGVAAILVPVTAGILPTVARVGRPDVPGPRLPTGRLLLAVATSAAVLTLNLGAQIELPLALVVAVPACVLALVAVRTLLPAGTLRFRRGLPSVVATRGLLSGAFFGAEVYLPLALTEQYDVPPTLAGVTLTFAAFAWAGASWVQGRLGRRLESGTAVRIGTVLVLVAVAGVWLGVLLDVHPVALVVLWATGGAGMGLAYGRLSVLVLGYSEPGTQGANSAAISISDAVGSSLVLALTGLALAAGTAAGGVARALSLAAVVAVAAALVAPRVRVPAGREGQAEAGTTPTDTSAART